MISTKATPFVTLANGRDFGLTDLADSYSGSGVYCITNPTPLTAISGHAAATTFDETKALFYLYNAGQKDIYMMQLLLKLSNAGTAGTTIRFTQCLDVGPRTPSSGNAAANTLTKGNTSGSGSSGATVYFGAVVIPAASSSRQIVGDAQYRSVIGVVKDTYGFVWGVPDSGLVSMPQTATDGTAELDISLLYGPVRVKPGYVFTIHQWSISQSGAYQFEPVCGYYAEG